MLYLDVRLDRHIWLRAYLVIRADCPCWWKSHTCHPLSPPSSNTGDGTCLLTGPSTSPENSLPAVKNVLKNGLPPQTPEKKVPPKQKAEREKPPPDVVFPFIAMSPAIGKHESRTCFLMSLVFNSSLWSLGLFFSIVGLGPFYFSGFFELCYFFFSVKGNTQVYVVYHPRFFCFFSLPRVS